MIGIKAWKVNENAVWLNLQSVLELDGALNTLRATPKKRKT